MTNLARGQRSTPDTPPSEEEQRSALTRLVTILAAGLLAALVTGTIRTVAVVVALIACIFLHELGHYLTAKWGHMKVTEFFIGFGPRLWSVRKGETEYGVKGIPVGAYVKVIGMNNLDHVDDPADEPRTYREQSYPRRLAVGLAGSFMHFLVAFVLLVVINGAVGKPHDTLRIGEISKLEAGPSPAQDAGLRLDDRIVSIGGKPVHRWDDLRDFIRARPGEDIELVVERGGEQVRLTAHTVDLHTVKVQGIPATAEPTGFVGIGPKIVLVKASPAAAVVDGAKDFGTVMGATFGALGKIFSPSGVRNYLHTLSGETTGPAGEETRFLSPVGFVRVASQAASTGLFEVLELLILINIFVGVFNLVPLLPLDGGHVAVATYEAIRSRISRRRYHVDAARLLPLTYAVFLVLVFLGLTSFYLDVVRPSPNPFK